MIKNQALGGRTNKALIFLGLFLGLVSAVLVVVYLSSAGDGGGGVSTGPATAVVVAGGDIPAGTRITEEMVTVKQIQADAVLAGAFGEIDNVVGQVTKVPLVAGEQVVPTKITATGIAIPIEGSPPLSLVVPEGQRGVAIQVNSVIAASGLIRPGDYVDVILTVKIEGEAEDGSSSGAKDQIASTVLQNALVLSIDQEVARALPSESEGGDGTVAPDADANPEAATVTLAVAPAHGEVLTMAETCAANFGGRLALALRGFGDESVVGTRTEWPENGPPPTCAAMLGISSLQ